MDNNNKGDRVIISRLVYENLVARDVISVFRGIYMDKIKKGTMSLDPKIIDLITEVEELFV